MPPKASLARLASLRGRSGPMAGGLVLGGPLAQWQSVRMACERSPVQARYGPPLRLTIYKKSLDLP